MSNLITGELFKNALISGAANITKKRTEVDELNVFPVPDGDTGTNMSMTINNASRVLARLESDSLEKISAEAASALLRGARGNSGVILSLLFRGISKGFRGVDAADSVTLAAALTKGVEAAFKAVMKPTEGTILTVARVAAEKATELAPENDDAVAVFEAANVAAKEALAQTPEMLPVLKKAGVVDAGGQGLVYIFDGMLSVFKDGVVLSENTDEGDEKPAPEVKPSGGGTRYTYCAEYTIKRDQSIDKSVDGLRAYLETIGDNVSVADQGDTVKVYAHSDNPGKVLQQGLKYGQLVDIKIENMVEQAQQEAHMLENPATTSDGTVLTPAMPEKKYGFVAVAAGEGLCSLFIDLGVDHMVQGGQTMNPSTDDILSAIEATPAEIVFVLPNNKNIIMAAEQAIPLATRTVFVLHTRSIPMGISAMLAFDESVEREENLINMNNAANHVGSGAVTYAARNSSFDGKEIQKGDILALKNGKISFIEKDDMKKAVLKLIKQLSTKDSQVVTLFYGSDVSEEMAEDISAAVTDKFQNLELTVIPGGQPVYYFIISVE